ncbi:E3 SUMO-protein ligase NSE2-like isoform X1 [Mytilus californianus]|uniref:E3 SUMO-protein ligase NSE2-like isoform X1 n=1 Tax=Mytilus californianus TaxID=6549 RepID=UPI0022469404|nr:E3 SUMO-protein ligase NSE2-like isoform X1 [Mytilus californianus]
MSSRTHFGVVDQAMKSMKTVEEYIKVGMETTLDVGMDFVEHDKDNEKQIDELRSVMKDYVRMERDLQQFMEAVECVKSTATKKNEPLDLEKELDNKLLELKQANKDAELTQHEKYVDLIDKVNEMQQPDCVFCEGSYAGPATSTQIDEDIAMTQPEVNTRCPYTGKDMINPVKNSYCGHHYDKEGISHYIKIKGRKAKCPVGGCGNDKPIELSDLIEDKDLKKFIDRKNRHNKKKN